VIAQLRGRVARHDEDAAIVDVQGVGYLVHASARTLRRLPAVGEPVELLTELHITDETMRLYGFTDEAERSCFRLLQTVQGVGSRVALSVLGVLGPDGLAAAVASGDKAALSRAPGVGARLAARITAELKDRLGGIAIAAALPAAVAGIREGVPDDALAALVQLGFGRAEAVASLGRVRARLGDAAALDALLRESLRELAR
jgi:Holliday junction DNA helicase RuvA